MFDELKKRHLFQIALLYLGGGWLFIEITDFLVGTYGMSRKILDTVVLLAVLGFPAFLIIGWFHGERGPQRARRSELWMLVTLGVMGAVGSYQIATGESIPEEGSAVETLAPAPNGDGDLVADAPDRLRGPSLAVLPFKNNIADAELAWLGSGLADLLTTNFAQIEGLQVVGRQRLYDLLTEEGRTEEEQIPDQLASAVARASGARTMLWGTVSGSADDLVIDAQIIDIETGAVIDAERVRGDDVFTMVDSLTMLLAPSVGLERAGRPPPPRLAIVGTQDMEALGAFHEGVALERAGKHEEAARSFERAASHDTTFILPMARLANRRGSRDRSEDREAVGEEVEAASVEVGAESREADAQRRAERYQRRALKILSELGGEFEIDIDGVSMEQFLTNLDVTLAQSLSKLDSIAVDPDSLGKTPRPPRRPSN